MNTYKTPKEAIMTLKKLQTPQPQEEFEMGGQRKETYRLVEIRVVVI